MITPLLQGLTVLLFAAAPLASRASGSMQGVPQVPVAPWTIRFGSPLAQQSFATATTRDGLAFSSQPIEARVDDLYVFYHLKLEHPVAAVAFDYTGTGDAAKLPIALFDAAANELWRSDGRGGPPRHVQLERLHARGQLVFRVQRSRGTAAVEGGSHRITGLALTTDSRPPVIGAGVILRDVDVTTSGSSPWGYGSLYGISGGDVRKMNGLRVGWPARGVQLVGCRVHMRAMGHAIFIQGAQDTVIRDCHVDGLLRPTNEILAEKSGYAFDRHFIAGSRHYIEGVTVAADGRILPDEMVSLSEDGIRMYDQSGPGQSTGPTTIVDCTVTRMRRGICTGLSAAADKVVNCEARECVAAGFNVGGGDTVENSRADAKYAEALCLPYLRARAARVELELLDSRGGLANRLLAAINGQEHRVVLRTKRPEFVPAGMAIEFATHAGYASYQRANAAATGIQLTNDTPASVLLLPGATGNEIASRGPVTDRAAPGNTVRKP